MTKWANFRLHVNLFGTHPTWGIWEVRKTGFEPEDDQDIADSPSTVSIEPELLMSPVPSDSNIEASGSRASLSVGHYSPSAVRKNASCFSRENVDTCMSDDVSTRESAKLLCCAEDDGNKDLSCKKAFCGAASRALGDNPAAQTLKSDGNGKG